MARAGSAPGKAEVSAVTGLSGFTVSIALINVSNNAVGLRISAFGLAFLDLSVIVDYNTMSPAGSFAARSFDMKAKITQYMSEIISLSVMLLMVVALVAGQADATLQAGPAIDAGKTHGVSATVIQEPVDPAHNVQIKILRLGIGMSFDDAIMRDLASEWSATLGGQLRLRRRQAGQD